MELSANWKKLKATFFADPQTRSPREADHEKKILKRKQPPTSASKSSKQLKIVKPSMDGNIAMEHVNGGLSETAEIGKYIAIDCEMVGVGPEPDRESALARVSIVNFNGEQVYDSFVRPKELVTDWRTGVSGISARDMREARSLEQVQADVSNILDGNVLVGHAIRNDLNALLLSHPKRDIRDTARHPPFRRWAGGGSPRLKILAAGILGIEIQSGAHSSVQDARATMLLFRSDKEAFEREHAKKWPTENVSYGKTVKQQQKKKKKKKKKGKTKKQH